MSRNMFMENEKPVYTCPFCGGEVPDTIEDLAEHRKRGGECDQRMDEQAEQQHRQAEEAYETLRERRLKQARGEL
jgi:hypothetical protein